MLSKIEHARKLIRGLKMMKLNQEPIILAERAADHGRLRAILREWGYRESEIQRFLKEPRVNQKLQTRRNLTNDQSGKNAHGVF